MTTGLIILDRDGVINDIDEDSFITSPNEWAPIPESLEAIARLNQAGYRVVVATNQSGISRNLYTLKDLNAIHEKMHEAAHAVGAEIDAIFFCPHALNEDCDCRKPKPGMLHAIAARFNIKLAGTPLIGDSLRDLQAAYVAGCTPHLVLTGNGRATKERGGLPPNTATHQSLSAFVDMYLNIGNDNSVKIND